MQYLRIKNWEHFQHYKDRSPPWIKLHRDLLRDYKFICLQDASKLHLMLIWLLASQMDNKIPADEEYIKNQIGVKSKIDFNELILNGFLVDDSNTLASCKQVAIVETETEAYREETEKDITPLPPKRGKQFPRPDDVNENLWNDFITHRKAKRAPITETVIKGFRSEASKAGFNLSQAIECSISRNWQSFKADWIKDTKSKGYNPNDAISLALADRTNDHLRNRSITDRQDAYALPKPSDG